MKKIETLKMNYEFKNVFNKGKYYIGKQVILYDLDNKLDYNRLGIAVSTKLCKAYYRNRIKRVIRACYQEIEKDAKKGHDLVFIWNKKEDINNLSYEIVYNDIKKAFSKIGII